ncbi:hypothetical protein PHSC3_000918 [Chlamydiales bacterium STE3]|nr:hypothetical protein PHSC3_000918 [Chlamydiales bacterium STE3]
MDSQERRQQLMLRFKRKALGVRMVEPKAERQKQSWFLDFVSDNGSGFYKECDLGRGNGKKDHREAAFLSIMNKRTHSSLREKLLL